MVTRLRTSDAVPFYAPTTWRGAWDQTNFTKDRVIRKDKSYAASSSASGNETSASNTWDVAYLRLVSDPLKGAQTITGTFDACFVLSESNASNDYVYHFHIFVTQGDTDNVRGTLLTDYVETLSNEWQTSTVGLRIASPQTLSSVSASDGDRIVVEVGCQAQNSSAVATSGSMTVGGTALDVVAGGTGTSWVEFSQDLVFKTCLLYLNDHAAPSAAASPSGFQGGWNDTAGAVTKQIAPDAYDSGVNATVSRAETSASGSFRVCLYRGISAPLTAQTVGGSFDVCIPMFENTTDADMMLSVHAYVMKSDGTVRGTLLNAYSDSTLANDEFNTGSRGQSLHAAQTLTNVSASAGDRIVVEIGYIATNTLTASKTGNLTYGGNVNDLSGRYGGYAVSGGSYTGSNNVWPFVAFWSGVDFQEPDARVSQDVVEFAITPDGSVVSISQEVVEVVYPYTTTGIKSGQAIVAG